MEETEHTVRTDACIVQRDFTVLLEVGHPGFERAREQLGMYSELVKTPAAFHTYRITPLSLWNAAALGWNADQVIASLEPGIPLERACCTDTGCSENHGSVWQIKAAFRSRSHQNAPLQ